MALWSFLGELLSPSWVLSFALLIMCGALLRQKKRLESVVETLGHDPVTKLPFETIAEELIVRLMRRASENWKKRVYVAVIFTDARGLKEVNRVAGQKGGDVYLFLHAEALKGLVRAPDVVFRRGGGSRADELIAVLVVPEAGYNSVHGVRLAQIVTALKSPKEIDLPSKSGAYVRHTMQPHIGVSGGMFQEVERGEEGALAFLHAVIEDADRAMEKEKAGK